MYHQFVSSSATLTSSTSASPLFYFSFFAKSYICLIYDFFFFIRNKYLFLNVVFVHSSDDTLNLWSEMKGRKIQHILVLHTRNFCCYLFVKYYPLFVSSIHADLQAEKLFLFFFFSFVTTERCY